MDDQQGKRRLPTRAAYVTVIVLLSICVAVGFTWWARQPDDERGQADSPSLPDKLCNIPISSEPVRKLHGEPQFDFYQGQSSNGGLEAPIAEKVNWEDGGYCTLHIDNEVINIAAVMTTRPLGESDVSSRLKGYDGKTAHWGEYIGYVYTGGSSEHAIISFPCALAKHSSRVSQPGLRVSVIGPSLRPGAAERGEVEKKRKIMIDLVADVTRYVAKHSAKCRNIDELPDNGPVLE